MVPRPAERLGSTSWSWPAPPLNVVGKVLTRAAPTSQAATQSPPLLNSAMLPSGFNAPTLTTGMQFGSSFSAPHLACGKNAAGYNARVVASLPARQPLRPRLVLALDRLASRTGSKSWSLGSSW